MGSENLKRYWRVETQFGLLFAHAIRADSVTVATMGNQHLPGDLWSKLCGDDVQGGPVDVFGAKYDVLVDFRRLVGGGWVARSANGSRLGYVTPLAPLMPQVVAQAHQTVLMDELVPAFHSMLERPEVASRLAALEIPTLEKRLEDLRGEREEIASRLDEISVDIQWVVDRLEAVRALAAGAE